MENLVEDLRTEAGSSFLADTRLVVATLVQRSSFVTMYRQNFLHRHRGKLGLPGAGSHGSGGLSIVFILYH